MPPNKTYFTLKCSYTEFTAIATKPARLNPAIDANRNKGAQWGSHGSLDLPQL